MKKKIFLVYSTTFYIDSKVPCSKGTSSYLGSAFAHYLDPVQMVLIFLIHFFSHEMLTILPPWKLNDGSVIVFVQTITCLDPFRR